LISIDLLCVLYCILDYFSLWSALVHRCRGRYTKLWCNCNCVWRCGGTKRTWSFPVGQQADRKQHLCLYCARWRHAHRLSWAHDVMNRSHRVDSYIPICNYLLCSSARRMMPSIDNVWLVERFAAVCFFVRFTTVAHSSAFTMSSNKADINSL